MRVRSLLLTLVLSLLVGKSLGASFTLDGITYVANADTAIIKGYDAIPENGELTLASTVSYGGKDYRVTTVQNSAFLSCTELKKLVVPSTIKYIREGAFENCVNMTQLVLSEGEERLDAVGDAFKNCGIEEATIGRNLMKGIFCNSESLVTVKLAKNVTTIPSYAFYGCKKLSAINLENVKRIGESAFLGCAMLKEVNIEKVVEIDREAFYGVGVEIIELPETLEDLNFLSFAYCESLKHVTIKSKLYEIPQSCFTGCSNLASVDFPLSLRKICYEAFKECNSLSQVSWGNVETIQSHAFENTGFKDLTMPVSLKKIDFDAFKGCLNLKKVDLTATSILTLNGFYRCESLKQVLLPQKLQEIENGCFSGCSELEEIEFPTTLNKISRMSFSNMTKLKEIDFSKTMVHVIPDYCFYGCQSLAKVILNVATDSIENGAFNGCSALSELLNCSNIKIVYADAFKDTKLFDGATDKGPVMVGSAMYKYNGTIEDKEYTVPSGVTCLCDGVFANFNFQAIKLNDGLLYIGDRAFDNCTNLVSLSIPGSVNYVGGSANCKSLTAFTVQTGGGQLSLGEFSGSPIKKLTLKRNLTSSCNWMPKLESLIIGKEVKTLWGNSFESSENLVNLELLDSDKKLSLGTLPINHVQSLYLGRNICDLKSSKKGELFSSFKELSLLTIGEAVDSICDYFAYNNTKLETLNIDGNVTYVGKSAFAGAVNLRTLKLSSNVKKVDVSAFGRLENIKSVTLNDGLENIEANSFAFTNKNTLPYIYIPKTVKTMGASAFVGIKCKKIIFPEGLEVIGHNAFSNVQTDSIVLPSTIKDLHESFTFSGIKYVDASRIKCNLNSSFYENRYLEKIILPVEGLNSLTENEFWYCESLENIDLPKTLKTIDHDAFSATKIEELHIPSSVTSVGLDIFRQVYDVKKEKNPIVFLDGGEKNEPVLLKRSFEYYSSATNSLRKLDVNRDFAYDFTYEDSFYELKLYVDSLILRDIREFEIKANKNNSIIPSTAICLSHYLTSCDRWKPTSGKVLVLPGSQLPKDETTEMYTVNKLAYEQPADDDVLFDGVNNMPFEIKPVFYKDNQEVTLKEVGDYDLSMKISGTSFDGIYPTGLKVSVSTASGIGNITVDEPKSNCPIYNLIGQRVDGSYKGIVIQKGKKRIAK